MITSPKPSRISVDWQKVADACRREDCQDAISVKEFMEISGLKRTSATAELKKMAKDKRAVLVEKTITASDGKTQWTDAYRLVK